MHRNPDIAVAVLHWGLGHATRSSMLIIELEHLGFHPLLVSSGSAYDWLQARFPHLPMVRMTDPDIQYGKYGPDLWWRLLRKGPAFFRRVKEEKQCVEKLFQTYPSLKACISDHCLGFYHSGKPSILVAHQLRLPIHFPGVQAFYKAMLRPFHRIWVPDVEEAPGWSGSLSHPSPFPEKTRYIGLLPHFQEKLEEPKHVLLLLSGPEPQRSLLEKSLVTHWPKQWKGNVSYIRGTTQPAQVDFPAHWNIMDRASTEEVKMAIRHAQGVVARNGYTTLMDLAHTPLHALFIPTPGQPEQQYLARLHQDKNGWRHVPQAKLDSATLTSWLQTLPTHRTGLPETTLTKPDLALWLEELGVRSRFLG
jgi:hypothetical protein